MNDPTAVTGIVPDQSIPASGGPDLPPTDPPPIAPSPDQSFAVPSPSEANPFVPQVVVPEAESPPPTAPPREPSAGNPWGKRIGILFIILVFVAAGIFGSRYLLGNIAGNKDITLTYWGLWENDSIIQPVISAFEAAHPNIKVQYEKQSHRQYRERLQGAINRAEGPDIFRFHSTWIPMFRNELAAAPAAVMSVGEFSSIFYPVAGYDLVGGQSIYGMPVMIDGLGLYYNEDLFSAAGVTPPSTWEELLNIVPKLTVKSDATILTSAVALGTTGNVEHFSDIIATMMMQNGAKLSAPVGTQAEEAVIFYRKFANPADPVYTWNDTLDNSIYAFATGKVAMIFAPSWRVFDIKQINPTLRFKVNPIPQLPGNTVTWASYWVEGVSAKSANQKAAWEFVKYLTGREATTMLYTEAAKTRLFGEPYARLDMGSMLTSDPYVGAFIKQASTAKSFPLASRTFDNGINDKLIKYMQDAMNAVGQGTAPAAALETAANGFRQVLGSYGLATGAAPSVPQ